MVLTGVGVLAVGLGGYYLFSRRAEAQEEKRVQDDAVASGGLTAAQIAQAAIDTITGSGGWSSGGWSPGAGARPKVNVKLAASVGRQAMSLSKKHGLPPMLAYKREREERIAICTARSWDNNRCKRLKERLDEQGISYSGYGAYGIKSYPFGMQPFESASRSPWPQAASRRMRR
jgi:hypothetical protein